MNRDELDVTVVVCAYTQRRWKHMLAALDSVLSQRPAPAQVLLAVDHNPTLASRARSARPAVSVLESVEERGVSGARNTGLQAATQPIIVYLDDDAEARPGWLESLIAPLSDPKVVGTAGNVQPRWPDHRPRWMPPEFDWVIGCTYQGLAVSEGSVRNPIGGNMSMRTRDAIEAGGFDARVGHVGDRSRGGEETDLSIRLTSLQPGSIFRYVPEAIVDHHIESHRVRFKYFLIRCWNEGISKAIVVRLNGSKGLESERRYVTGALPTAIRRDLAATIKGDPNGFMRMIAIIAGLSVTMVAYALGRVRLVGRSYSGLTESMKAGGQVMADISPNQERIRSADEK